MKSNSDTRPDALLDLGDGSLHYNFNIEEIEETDQETEEVFTKYQYDTVTIWGPPTYAKLVKAVVRDRYDETQEFGIINDYNAYALGLTQDESAEDAYTEFLSWLLGVKEMVATDISAQ